MIYLGIIGIGVLAAVGVLLALLFQELTAIKERLERIMATQAELVNAATELSTKSDALSIKVDGLIVKVDAVVKVLQDAELPPEATAALAALKTSAATAQNAGAAVDAQVLKLDSILPTPAPAGN